MDSKNMKKLNLDEMDKVSGGNGSGNNASEMRCMCGSTNVEEVLCWEGGSKKIKCKDCGRISTIYGN